MNWSDNRRTAREDLQPIREDTWWEPAYEWDFPLGIALGAFTVGVLWMLAFLLGIC